MDELTHVQSVRRDLVNKTRWYQRKARKTIRNALKASEIGGDYDFSQKPEGWTDEEYRVAMDARLPKKSAPYYLEIAKQVASDMDRNQADEKQPLNIGTVNIVQAINYATKKLIGEGDK